MRAHTHMYKGAFTLGDANDGRVEKMGEGKRRAKSRSPCAACGSKTRSSFLHLQVECRDIRGSPHCCDCNFSIPDFRFLVLPRLSFSSFRSRPVWKRRMAKIVLHRRAFLRTLKGKSLLHLKRGLL